MRGSVFFRDFRNLKFFFVIGIIPAEIKSFFWFLIGLNFGLSYGFFFNGFVFDFLLGQGGFFRFFKKLYSLSFE